MLLYAEEIKRLSRDDRRTYALASDQDKQRIADHQRQIWADSAVRKMDAASQSPNGLGVWLMIGGMIFVLIGFFYDVGVGSDFDRVVNIGKMGEKFAFIFIGLGTLITGSIFWNANRIIKATLARR